MTIGVDEPDAARLDVIARRARRPLLTRTPLALVAGVLGARALRPAIGMGSSDPGATDSWADQFRFAPVDLFPFAFGAALVLVILVRRERRPAREGLRPDWLVAGLSMAQRRRIWRSVRSGDPGPDPTLRVVERTTAHTVVKNYQARLVGTAAVIRIRILWMPLAAPYRVWFRRSLAAFLAGVGCALTSFGVALAEGPVPGSVPAIRSTLVALESVLGALGYLISFVVVACLITGIWSYLHGGRSETATERTFRP